MRSGPGLWDWIERFSWVVAIIVAIASLVAVLVRRRTGREQTRHDAGAGRFTDGASVDVPADQPGGAVGGRTLVRGREALLGELAPLTGRMRLRRRPRVWVLYGLGGSGKTTVAWAAAKRARSHGIKVWWLSAAEPMRLDAGMRRVAVEAGGRPEEIDKAWADHASAANLVWRLLDRYPHRWLLVLDRADRPEVLTVDDSPLPDGRGWLRPVTGRRGGVIATSRDSNAEHFGSWCRMAAVGALSPADGARMLVDHAGPAAGQPADARALSERLGGLPLALRLTGSYLSSANRATLPGDITTMADFLAILNEATLTDRSSGRGRLVEQLLLDNVREVWERSLDHVAAQGVPEGRAMLRLLSTFADAPVPLVLLVSTVLSRSTLFASVDELRLRLWLDALADLSLVDLTSGTAAVPVAVLHPLVRDAGRLNTQESARGFLVLAADLLHEVCGSEMVSARTEDPRQWAFWQALAPHSFSVLDQLGGLGETPADAVRKAAAAAVQAGRSLRARGLYGGANEELRKVVDICTAALGRTDRTTLTARFNLARVLRDQGRYELAEQDFREVRETAERSFGPEDKLTMSARHERARVLHAQGQLSAAEQELREVHALTVRVLGGERPLTLAARYELARVLFSREEMEEARAHFRAVYDVERRILGEDHLDTLNARHQAARVALASGAPASAEQDMREVLAVRVRVLGELHPTTVATRYNLAEVLFRTGSIAVAEREFRAVTAISTELLGADHPGTLSARHDWAAALAALGRNEHAKREFISVHDARSRVLGAEHPSTLRTQDELTRLGVGERAHGPR